MKVKEESEKVGLKLNIQKTKIMASGPITSWEIDGESCSFISNSLRPQELYSPWNSPGQNTGVGSLSFLQGIFPTKGLKPGLLHCRQILYQLSHQGIPVDLNCCNMNIEIYKIFTIFLDYIMLEEA